jgi:hypothetical protein
MPTVLRIGPYRFFFYAGDREEPPHVHVERDDSQAKFWLAPVRFQKNRGFKKWELERIENLIERNQESLMDSWEEYFNG